MESKDYSLSLVLLLISDIITMVQREYFSPERELGLELLLVSLTLEYFSDLLAGGETPLLLARWSWDREVRGGTPAGAGGL